MAERLIELLPSIIVLFIVAVSAFIFFEIAISRCIKDQNHNKIEAFQEWAKNNKKRAFFVFHLPTLLLFSPSREELIFRAPLLVLFGTVSGLAWLGIIVSATAFSLMHYFSPLNEPLFEATRAGKDENEKKGIRKIKKARGIVSFTFGMLSGYLGIRCQSLWLCAGVHAGWNLIAPVLIPILIPRLKKIIDRHNTAN